MKLSHNHSQFRPMQRVGGENHTRIHILERQIKAMEISLQQYRLLKKDATNHHFQDLIYKNEHHIQRINKQKAELEAELQKLKG